MTTPDNLSADYDSKADTLYVTLRRARALSREEAEPGVYWRYDMSDGTLVGVTILDFDSYWSGQIQELVKTLADRFQVSRKVAQTVLRRPH